MEGPETAHAMSRTLKTELEKGLSHEERGILGEVVQALRAIRYGSVLLTVHDGHVVEIQKTERIRKISAKEV